MGELLLPVGVEGGKTKIRNPHSETEFLTFCPPLKENSLKQATGAVKGGVCFSILPLS